MATVHEELRHTEMSVPVAAQPARWVHWPVFWSAVWVGALSALAAGLIFGLIGVAVGAHLLGPDHRIVNWKDFHIGSLIFSVFGAFLAYVIAGWVTAKVAGLLRSEPAMLHGAIAWLVTVPFLLAFAAFGAGGLFGGWYGGLAGTPAWASSATPLAPPGSPGAAAGAAIQARNEGDTAQYRADLDRWKEETGRATRNSALGAVTALLLGLVGSVVGGWWASGEPMNFTYHKTRRALASHSP
jgi:uncharacterized membrane protein YeaQ/YmgE (transglycosylase-associated protein family)